jgi:hypothetical protein
MDQRSVYSEPIYWIIAVVLGSPEVDAVPKLELINRHDSSKEEGPAFDELNPYWWL